MLYKFKSKETSDLILMATDARQILTLIGKEPHTKGIVLVNEMPLAIQQLQDAVHAEDAAVAEARRTASQKAQAHERCELDPQFDAPSHTISLKQRATPFIEMLKRAQAAQVEVVWGV